MPSPEHRPPKHEETQHSSASPPEQGAAGRRSSSSQARARLSASRGVSGRLIRTLVLGSLAVFGAIYWLGEEYGVDREETLSLLVSSLVFVLVLVGAGLAGAAFIGLVRWLRRK